jgi:hypothetical protein
LCGDWKEITAARQYYHSHGARQSGRLNLAPSHMINRFLEPPTQKKHEFTQFDRDSDSTALDASRVKQVNIKLRLGLASKK